MATQVLKFNQLNYEAMEKKSIIRQGNTYHEEGIGTVTILMAIITLSVIIYSIYSSF